MCEQQLDEEMLLRMPENTMATGIDEAKKRLLVENRSARKHLGSEEVLKQVNKSMTMIVVECEKLVRQLTGQMREMGRGKSQPHTSTSAAVETICKEAKKVAKKAVAVARATHYNDVNVKLKSRDGERFLYRHAKVRHRQTEDVEPYEDTESPKSS
ncbi:unnamed protein product [Heligmosomoides polygyrus]|uniref:Uncharacterized protein n=1 Tax=Heligmosomoides polygyrus TaxID=6339 RepID=A0A3P8A5N8_HELPZ|nr:unnamed protein product [Heligmosomoides polygyrus]